MLFNSYIFIFLFLPIVLVGFLYLRHKAPIYPITWIVTASLFYYGWWKPEFLILLLASISINLIFGKVLIHRNLSQTASRITLASGIIFNLSALAYFKYAGFFIININELFGAGLPIPNILLPLGISFITFQKIAFLVDAHRGLVRNFSVLHYIFFVTFFPQLIAGPIVHHSEIMPQLAESTRRNFKLDFSIGMSIFIIGLFKKVVLADSIGVYADAGYAMLKSGQSLDTASAWITIISYSIQLYFDFSAYSDMAIGFARMFGIQLPLNFFSPYKSSSIIDFWRRWHITLSRFLKDYLYIPLGGNRHGFIRRYSNLALVMLLGGLWHGANWTFAIWGGAHGLCLAINHAWRRLAFTRHALYQSHLVKIMAISITFFIVTLAWVPFRAETIHDMQTMFKYLFPLENISTGWSSFTNAWHAQISHLDTFSEWFKPRELWPPVLSPDYLGTMAHPLGLILCINLLIIFMMPNTAQLFANFEPALGTENYLNANKGAIRQLDGRVAFVLALMFILSILQLSHVSPFLYFQF